MIIPKHHWECSALNFISSLTNYAWIVYALFSDLCFEYSEIYGCGYLENITGFICSVRI